MFKFLFGFITCSIVFWVAGSCKPPYMDSIFYKLHEKQVDLTENKLQHKQELLEIMTGVVESYNDRHCF